MLNWQAFPSRLDNFRCGRFDERAPDNAQPECGQQLTQTLLARGPHGFQGQPPELPCLPQGVTINLYGPTRLARGG